ncbi:MAG: hypothetical protein V3U07_03390 [Nitrospirales bacterium]
MLYEFGVGEVAISIGSDPDAPEFLDHTIRIVGRVTQVLGRYCQLNPDLADWTCEAHT